MDFPSPGSSLLYLIFWKYKMPYVSLNMFCWSYRNGMLIMLTLQQTLSAFDNMRCILL